MLTTEFLIPRGAEGRIRMSHMKSRNPPAVTAESAGHAAAIAGQLYDIFNVHTLGYALASTEIFAALLIALRPLWPRVSAVGSAFAVLLFCSTISFLFTTPGVTAGGPVLSMLGEFPIKDIALLGVSL